MKLERLINKNLGSELLFFIQHKSELCLFQLFLLPFVEADFGDIPKFSVQIKAAPILDPFATTVRVSETCACGLLASFQCCHILFLCCTHMKWSANLAGEAEIKEILLKGTGGVCVSSSFMSVFSSIAARQLLDPDASRYTDRLNKLSVLALQ